VNYGAAPNLQLHVIAPMAISEVKNETSYYGYGDTELGIKYRFLKEKKWRPQIGVFPIIELPSGNHSKGLGNGNIQVYIPLWIQKSFGKWTTYGGAGYWFNPGKGNRDWQFYGWMLQYQILDKWSLGTELYHVTASQADVKAETRVNLGSVVDVNEHNHLLFSIGTSFNGSTKVQGYMGYQLTFGKG